MIALELLPFMRTLSRIPPEVDSETLSEISQCISLRGLDIFKTIFNNFIRKNTSRDSIEISAEIYFRKFFQQCF